MTNEDYFLSLVVLVFHTSSACFKPESPRKHLFYDSWMCGVLPSFGNVFVEYRQVHRGVARSGRQILTVARSTRIRLSRASGIV